MSKSHIAKIVTVGSAGSEILRKDLTGLTTTKQDLAALPFSLHRAFAEHCESGGDGYAIAANQIGVSVNAFYVSSRVRLLGKAVGILLLNPTWEPDEDGEHVEMNEGCLSLPQRHFVVRRHTRIIASWDDAAGHRITGRKLTGLRAQVFQHEHDHLLGRTLLETAIHELVDEKEAERRRSQDKTIILND